MSQSQGVRKLPTFTQPAFRARIYNVFGAYLQAGICAEQGASLLCSVYSERGVADAAMSGQKEIVENVLREIVSGKSLSASFIAAFPNLFPEEEALLLGLETLSVDAKRREGHTLLSAASRVAMMGFAA